MKTLCAIALCDVKFANLHRFAAADKIHDRLPISGKVQIYASSILLGNRSLSTVGYHIIELYDMINSWCILLTTAVYHDNSPVVEKHAVAELAPFFTPVAPTECNHLPIIRANK